ncbi:MAG: ThuA domain-containing protein [Oscillospiraceae bacterium]|nr:ThuA domain-containing protein [Oscillospiraceae bacterium]
MKILVICDDIYHHVEVVREGLAFLFLQDECDLTYAVDMTEYSFEDKPLSGYNVVIIAKDDVVSKSKHENWFTEDIEKQFENYANSGGGLIFLHAGSVLCKKSKILRDIAGCEFVNHPEQCIVDFKIISDHEITSGAKDFSEKDEHYFIDFKAIDADVFLESSSENGTQPAGYARVHNGKGRVCVLTPGHNLNVFENLQYQKIIRNAVYWCAK